MTLGSFTVDGKKIDVERGWTHFDGIVYRLIDAKTRKEIAVSRHRGLDLAAGLRMVLGLPS